MKHRYTVETLQTGQTKPYGDTVHRVLVTFEMIPYRGPQVDYQPMWMSENAVRDFLPNLKCGFMNVEREQRKHGLDTYLDYLKPVNPKKASEIIPQGSPEQVQSHQWEFQVVTPWND